MLKRALLGVVVLGAWAGATAARAHDARLDPATAATLGAAIRAAGHPCPAARYAYAREAELLGTFLRVHCGPADQPEGGAHAIYRVHLTNGTVSRVEPWPEWHGRRN